MLEQSNLETLPAREKELMTTVCTLASAIADVDKEITNNDSSGLAYALLVLRMVAVTVVGVMYNTYGPDWIKFCDEEIDRNSLKRKNQETILQ